MHSIFRCGNYRHTHAKQLICLTNFNVVWKQTNIGGLPSHLCIYYACMHKLRMSWTGTNYLLEKKGQNIWIVNWENDPFLSFLFLKSYSIVGTQKEIIIIIIFKFFGFGLRMAEGATPSSWPHIFLLFFNFFLYF